MRRRKRRKGRFPRINGDTMTTIVLFALAFCTAVVIWGMRQAAAGIDSAAIVDSALRVFGTELGICGVMTIFRRWTEAQDRRTEEQRRRREERRAAGSGSLTEG